MLKHDVSIGVWSDEMPPVNLHNYPMKNAPKSGQWVPAKEPTLNEWVAHQAFEAARRETKEGLKYDKDKPRMDLLDADFLEGVAQVLTFGAKKYAANNWRNGIAVSRLVAAAYRHLGAINRGEDIDPESGLSHVYHLGCCTMFLSEMLKRSEQDDRYTKVKK